MIWTIMLGQQQELQQNINLLLGRQILIYSFIMLKRGVFMAHAQELKFGLMILLALLILLIPIKLLLIRISLKGLFILKTIFSIFPMTTKLPRTIMEAGQLPRFLCLLILKSIQSANMGIT